MYQIEDLQTSSDANNNQFIVPGLSAQRVTGSYTASWNGTGVAPANTNLQLVMNGHNNATFTITGTYNISIFFEMSADGTTWVVAPYTNMVASVGTGLSTSSFSGTNVTASYIIFAPGSMYVRARCSTFTSGTATAVLVSCPFTALPGITNLLGSSTSGGIYTIATNTTLAASTYSTVAACGYSNAITLFFLATAATAGVVSIYLSGEGTYYGLWTTTITQNAAVTPAIIALPPVRYVKLISTVALTAFTANVTAKF